MTDTPPASPEASPFPPMDAAVTPPPQAAPQSEPQGAPQPTPQAAASAPAGDAASAQAVFDVPVDVQVVLGHAHMTVDRVMKLGRGAVVEIERRVGEAVEVCVNDHLVARGEVVIVDGDKLGVALTEVVGAPGA